MGINKLNLFGAYLAVFILLTSCLIFVFRLLNKQTEEYWGGIVLIATVVPLVYLIYAPGQHKRPTLYFIQLSLMLIFIIAELLLDYIFKIDFRHTKWMLIPYVMLFFAATGGMVGVAAQAGKFWLLLSVVFFLIMTALSFMQHAKTNL